MLSRINCNSTPCELNTSIPLERVPSKYQRNEQEDMKKGIEYLYEFKEKLSNLHPAVLDAIENMLQHHRRY